MTNWLEEIEKDNNFFYKADGYFHARYNSSTIWTPLSIKMMFKGYSIQILGTHVLPEY